MPRMPGPRRTPLARKTCDVVPKGTGQAGDLLAQKARAPNDQYVLWVHAVVL